MPAWAGPGSDISFLPNLLNKPNMSTINSSKRTSTKPFLFETELNLLPDGRGILTADDVKGTIYFSTPPAFGGPKDNWSPEHLLLCAISSCFMTTYQFFSRDFEITDIRCDSIGRIDLAEGKYRFAQVDLYPTIYVASNEILKQAEDAVAKTIDHCLVAHALKCQLIYHSQVLLSKT
jgi:organic hydroperoxide reductase OsmC/OhrA